MQLFIEFLLTIFIHYFFSAPQVEVLVVVVVVVAMAVVVAAVEALLLVAGEPMVLLVVVLQRLVTLSVAVGAVSPLYMKIANWVLMTLQHTLHHH